MAKRRQEKTATATATVEPEVEQQSLTVQVPANSAELMGIEKVFQTAQLAQSASTHNFGDDKFKALGLVSACKSASVESLDSLQGAAIELMYYFVHVVQINKQNHNGLVPAIRTVLVARDGAMYDSLSEYVARDMMNLIEVVGSDPIPDGFMVKMETVKSGNRKVNKLVFSPPE